MHLSREKLQELKAITGEQEFDRFARENDG